MIFLLAVSILLLVTLLAWHKIQTASSPYRSCERYKALVTLGIGGHIREMYDILKALEPHKYDFSFLSDVDDTFTLGAFQERFLELFNRNKPRQLDGTTIDWEDICYRIPVPKTGRGSKIKLLLNVVKAFLLSWFILYKLNPDIIITNGPGIAVPVAYAAFFMRRLKLTRSKILYIESYCRVENLSCSGMLVYYIADGFIVMWPQLASRYPKAKCFGYIEEI